MSQNHAPRDIKKLVIFGSCALCVPIFLVSMAYLAVSSDAKNKEKYKQQQAEQMAKIAAQKAESSAP